jgi:N-acetyl sugar amidotransferase
MSIQVHEVRSCARCVLDTHDDPAMVFDLAGVCTHCRSFERRRAAFVSEGQAGKEKLDLLVRTIRTEGKNRPFDCVAGISGGIDSTYSVYVAKQLGLRPLVVHLDNGWNSELAVKNIQEVVRKLGFELYTYVVNWEEFRDLQRSYIQASVVDIEVPTDHGILALLHRAARKQKTRFILSGSNILTEGVMPEHWVWAKFDLLNLASIHRTYGTLPLRTFPRIGFWKRIYMEQILRHQTVELLNLVPYVKSEARKILSDKLGWRDYGGKHYESVFTRFYQGYILPKKFGVDKRKAHLSCLIASGQMTKAEALAELSSEPYDSKRAVEDRGFVLKKLGFTEAEFEVIMRLPLRSHLEFPSYLTRHYRYHTRLSEWLQPIRRVKHRLARTSEKTAY